MLTAARQLCCGRSSTLLPPTVFRGSVDPGLAPGHLEGVLCDHHPADQRRAGVAPAIGAVTQRMDDRFPGDLVTNLAAVTAAGHIARGFLQLIRGLPGSITLQPRRLQWRISPLRPPVAGWPVWWAAGLSRNRHPLPQPSPKPRE